MLNRKHFPFERNAYYYGKPQMSRDHELEQRYNNNKRRLGNQLAGGHGIVSGLGVVLADDSSLVIQAGSAYDSAGREIVVPETKVVKLSTLDGFDSLESPCAYLGLLYDETPVDEVFPAMSQQGEPDKKTYNHIVEGYRLTLRDEAGIPRIAGPLDQFVSETVLYSDNEVEIIQYVPRFVVRDADLCIQVRIRKTGHGLGEYAFRYELQAPDFCDPNGKSAFQVSASGLRMTHGDEETLRYVLRPQPYVWSGREVVVTASDLLLKKNDEALPISHSWPSTLKPVDTDITGCYLGAWYGRSMDKVLGDSQDDMLWIAKLELIRQKNTVLISAVEPPPFRQYSYNAQQLMALRYLERYYPAGTAAATGGPREERVAAPDRQQAEVPDLSRMAASGVFDLGLGLGYSTKEAVYSEEIMHGLGSGPVYVEIGVEYIGMNGAQGKEDSEIYLGDISVFAQEEQWAGNERIYKVATAVKVLPERGTFIVGVLPKETSGLISLRIRWYAMRIGEKERPLRNRDGEQYIVISPDTLMVEPKGTAHIKPSFVGMPPEACRFQVIDEDGGTIDNNGVYTAPAKEGVYEIRVEAISDPGIYACAFAMVSQNRA